MYPTELDNLTAESVQGASLALEGVDHIHGGHGLPLGVLGVGDGITDDILEENLENTTGLLVDEAGDALDTTTTSQTADGGLGDTLDVITKNLPVALGAPLSESLSSFAASSHVDVSCVEARMKLGMKFSPIYRERAGVNADWSEMQGGF
jgi:hypothetical protein